MPRPCATHQVSAPTGGAGAELATRGDLTATRGVAVVRVSEADGGAALILHTDVSAQVASPGRHADGNI